jgi:hypothetical protein
MSRLNRTILMNSAMMPTEGLYSCQRINEADFARMICEAAADCRLMNNIGYLENLVYIEKLTGISLVENRAPTFLCPGDRILAMRTKYVEKTEQRRKSRRVGPREWEYFVIDFSELPEVA